MHWNVGKISDLIVIQMFDQVWKPESPNLLPDNNNIPNQIQPKIVTNGGTILYMDAGIHKYSLPIYVSPVSNVHKNVELFLRTEIIKYNLISLTFSGGCGYHFSLAFGA